MRAENQTLSPKSNQGRRKSVVDPWRKHTRKVKTDNTGQEFLMSTQELFLNKDPEKKPNLTLGSDHLYILDNNICRQQCGCLPSFPE